MIKQMLFQHLVSENLPTMFQNANEKLLPEFLGYCEQLILVGNTVKFKRVNLCSILHSKF